MIPDLAMQVVLSNAQLACLVDTDNGTKATDSPACGCSQGATDDARTPKCEQWMRYSEPQSAKTQPVLGGADGGTTP